MAFFSGLRRAYQVGLDGPRLPLAAAPVEGAGDAVRRFQQLQAEQQRLHHRRSNRERTHQSELMGGSGTGTLGAAAAMSSEGNLGRVADALHPPTHDGVRLNDPVFQEKLRRGGGLNGFGYVPTIADRDLLARIIYAESYNTPEDDVAIGWATVNRIGRPEFRDSLEGVLRQPIQFQIVAEGNPGGGDSTHWTESGRPDNLPPPQRARLARARMIADGILSGQIADPTGHAPYFHASLDPARPRRNARFFQRALDAGTIKPSIYTSRARGQRRNYFYVPTKRPEQE